MAPGKLTHITWWQSTKARFADERHLRHERDMAEAAENQLAARMLELKRKFDRYYPQPHAARLCLHRTGRSMALRWRLTGAERKNHDYFELRHDKSPGREILDSLPKTHRSRYLKFQADSLILNAAYAIHRYQRDRLADHIQKAASLAETLAHYRGE